MTIINNRIAWMESKRELGWKVTESITSIEPNPYGDGEIYLLERHWVDENGNYAGVLTREAFRKTGDWAMTVRFRWTPFTLDRSDYSSI